MNIPKTTIIGTLRMLLFRAAVSSFIIALSPLIGVAADISTEDNFQNTYEQNEMTARNAKKNVSGNRIITDRSTSRSNILLNQITDSFLFALGTTQETLFRAETTKVVVNVPLTINDYRVALEKYLSLVDTLLPALDLQQPLHQKVDPFFTQTNPTAGSFSSADFAASSKKEKPLLRIQGGDFLSDPRNKILRYTTGQQLCL